MFGVKCRGTVITFYAEKCFAKYGGANRSPPSDGFLKTSETRDRQYVGSTHD